MTFSGDNPVPPGSIPMAGWGTILITFAHGHCSVVCHDAWLRFPKISVPVKCARVWLLMGVPHVGKPKSSNLCPNLFG